MTQVGAQRETASVPDRGVLQEGIFWLQTFTAAHFQSPLIMMSQFGLPGIHRSNIRDQQKKYRPRSLLLGHGPWVGITMVYNDLKSRHIWTPQSIPYCQCVCDQPFSSLVLIDHRLIYSCKGEPLSAIQVPCNLVSARFPG